MALAASRSASGAQDMNFSRASSGADVSIGVAVTMPMDVSKINSSKEKQIQVMLHLDTWYCALCLSTCQRMHTIVRPNKEAANSDRLHILLESVSMQPKLAVSAMAGVPIENLEIENMENAGAGSVHE